MKCTAVPQNVSLRKGINVYRKNSVVLSDSLHKNAAKDYSQAFASGQCEDFAATYDLHACYTVKHIGFVLVAE